MSRTIFDVGANDCTTFLNEARAGSVVYAFEPVPELISPFVSNLRDNPCPTFNVVSAAVSDTDGISKFNIAGWHNYGCSSLHEFSDDLDRSCAPFVATHSILVPTIRMDTFIRSIGVETVDYLHIDTQGNDLKVLKSFGEELHRVVSGVAEVPNRVALYKNMHTKQDLIDFLEENGFRITRIENNYGDDGEQNVFFERK